MAGVASVLNVRLATSSDRDEVLRLVNGLLVELGGSPRPADSVSMVIDELADGGDSGFIVIAEVDSAAKAVCTASFVQALRTVGRYAIFQEMYVEPDWRSSGIGRAVIDFALERAVACGCQVVELGTPSIGDRQIEFYERAGFVNVGARLRWTTSGNRFR
jgi:GNAT superfamily N-acetyltransferase